jgi:hypothetical protein
LGVNDPWGQPVELFLASVEGVSQSCGGCDLLVAAGLTVNGVPSAATILEKSDGLPVLFEAKRRGVHSWLLAHRQGCDEFLTLLRRAQVVTSFNQFDLFPGLAKIIASGAGQITFTGADLKLVLLICGENNVLNFKGKASVLKGIPNRETERKRLAEVLGGPWIVLNPAHEPYYPQIRSTGFAKVGEVRSKKSSAGPTLKWLVEAETRFRDGTRSPVAVVHVNNFYSDVPKTTPFAQAVFGDTEERVQSVHGPIAGSMDGSDAHWRSSVYEIQE